MSSSLRLASSDGLRDVNVSSSGVACSVSLGAIVSNGGLDGIFSQHGTMQLDGWQAQFLCNFGIFDLSGLFERHSLDPLRHVTATSNGRSTAKRLESNVFDDSLFVDLDGELHDITTCRGTYKTNADVLFRLEEGANVSRVLVLRGREAVKGWTGSNVSNAVSTLLQELAPLSSVLTWSMTFSW